MRTRSFAMRARMALCVLAAAILAPLLLYGPAAALAAKPARGKPRTRHARAQSAEMRDLKRGREAYKVMQRHYYLRGIGLYRGEPVAYSYLWPFSQALAATVMLDEAQGGAKLYTTELSARLSSLEMYFDTSNSDLPEGTFTSALPGYDGEVALPTGPGGTKYYDDNEWVGIELVRVYKLTHLQPYLERAEQILAFVEAGWQSDPTLPCPGGVPFSNKAGANAERNLVSNGPGAELAAQLYAVTGDTEYLRFAEMAYEWARACLLQPSNLYADHFAKNGTINQALWSYNQGSMMGAGVLLYQDTGNSGFLWEARQTAAAALAHFTPAILHRENPFFVSVYFRNLLYLDSVTHDPPGRAIAQEYVEYAWRHDRSASGVYTVAENKSRLLAQAAIVQIYGLLSSSPSTYF